MFERLTQQVREAVVHAQEEAKRLGHNYLGCEHLLLGALALPQAPGVAALSRLGVTADQFRSAALGRLGSGGPGFAPGGADLDADALAAIGIDLAEVRRSVEEGFGPGSLDHPPQVQRPRGRRPWRRRGCKEVTVAGPLPFSDRAKRVLQLAPSEAMALEDDHVGVEHLLLALIREGGNLALLVLHDVGAEPRALRGAVLAELGKA